MTSTAIKGLVLSFGFFVFGILLSPYVPVVATGMLSAPSTHIPFESIELYQNELRIKEPNLQYAQVRSGSMSPVIPKGATIVEKKPNSPRDILIGDIISFYEPVSRQVVVHQVTDIYARKEGTYYATQGVANLREDPWKVPYTSVQGILVAVLR